MNLPQCDIKQLPSRLVAKAEMAQSKGMFDDFVDTIRGELETSPEDPVLLLVLAWGLLKVVETGIHIDHLDRDALEAQEILTTFSGWENFVSSEWMEKCKTTIQFVLDFTKQEQADVLQYENTKDAKMTSRAAAELGYHYDSRDPAKAAHYFELAAKKKRLEEDHSEFYDYLATPLAYFRAATHCLIKSGQWEKALPRLYDDLNSPAKNADDALETSGIYWYLLEHAACNKDKAEFCRIWKEALEKTNELERQFPDPLLSFLEFSWGIYQSMEAAMEFGCEDIVSSLVDAANKNNRRGNAQQKIILKKAVAWLAERKV